MIDIKFEDDSRGTDYKFKAPSRWDNRWTVVPRIGDFILDTNEFKYQVVGAVLVRTRQRSSQSH